jgi:hypothetical protein
MNTPILPFSRGEGRGPSPVSENSAPASIAADRRGRRFHRFASHNRNSRTQFPSLPGICRTIGAAPVRKTPLLADTAHAMALSVPPVLKGPPGPRIALVGLGWRVSPLRADRKLIRLDVADLGEADEGLRVTSVARKPTRKRHGHVVDVIRGTGQTCPVKAVKAWLEAAGITEGPVFRPVAKGGRLGAGRLSGKSVCTLVQAYAARLGLDAEAFGAHSLRSGFLTSAARRGASVFKMRDVSWHKSMDVLQAYVRDADLFRDHAGAGLL